jgi:hypothetical protein
MLFGLNTFLLIAFSICAYGLFKRYSWGRTLFLWVISIWAVLNLTILFAPIISSRQPISQKSIISAIYYILALALPILYLNLAQVKLIFQPSSKNSKTEDTNVD